MREVRPGDLEEEDPLKDLVGQHLLVVVTDECILTVAAVTFVLQEEEGSGMEGEGVVVVVVVG